MPLTPEEEKEYNVLWNRHGIVLLYPQNYTHLPDDDIFVDDEDKHEWHSGAMVRKLSELHDKKDATP